MLNLGCLERKKRKELEMQKGPERATALFPVWVAIEVFSIAIKLSSSVSRQSSLCRDKVRRLQAVLGRDKGSLGRDRAS